MFYFYSEREYEMQLWLGFFHSNIDTVGYVPPSPVSSSDSITRKAPVAGSLSATASPAARGTLARRRTTVGATSAEAKAAAESFSAGAFAPEMPAPTPYTDPVSPMSPPLKRRPASLYGLSAHEMAEVGDALRHTRQPRLVRTAAPSDISQLSIDDDVSRSDSLASPTSSVFGSRAFPPQSSQQQSQQLSPVREQQARAAADDDVLKLPPLLGLSVLSAPVGKPCAIEPLVPVPRPAAPPSPTKADPLASPTTPTRSGSQLPNGTSFRGNVRRKAPQLDAKSDSAQSLPAIEVSTSTPDLTSVPSAPSVHQRITRSSKYMVNQSGVRRELQQGQLRINLASRASQHLRAKLGEDDLHVHLQQQSSATAKRALQRAASQGEMLSRASSGSAPSLQQLDQQENSRQLSQQLGSQESSRRFGSQELSQPHGSHADEGDMSSLRRHKSTRSLFVLAPPTMPSMPPPPPPPMSPTASNTLRRAMSAVDDAAAGAPLPSSHGQSLRQRLTAQEMTSFLDNNNDSRNYAVVFLPEVRAFFLVFVRREG